MYKNPLSELKPTDLDFIFNSLPNTPIYIKDLSLKYIYVNKEFVHLVGRKNSNEIIGKKSNDFYPANESIHYENLDSEVIRYASPMTLMIEPIGNLTENIWINYFLLPVTNKDNKVSAVMGVGRLIRVSNKKVNSYRRTSKALLLMGKYLDQHLSIDEISCSLGISVSQLNKDFKTTIKTTPRNYQSHIKLQLSKKLLIEGYPLVDVSHMCGFSNQSSFTRFFKTHTGVTPGKYRSSKLLAQ